MSACPQVEYATLMALLHAKVAEQIANSEAPDSMAHAEQMQMRTDRRGTQTIEQTPEL
jgi:hypothetical protein